ncbi:ATP-binding protein [Bacteroidia bacterium]|nr:ATP-binding protein [Bacteroidia bacterium]
MKYLNKIIFINSADKSLPYSEVNLDGNVHFIGTQGVGKSTLLRTILFFYNADKTKLGIKAGQKSYDEYYFPYQNSFIIYEVQTDNSAFCVLTFKSQGRVAFRFFDSAYNKENFIDSEGKAFETWDKIRDSFGRNISYTRIISSYEEFRNILYGNNKELQKEFRKYALIESKQYQNIPRTISNVFLNTKLDAEFVKETIIKSLNEDEIKIDLTTYSQHLKDFEVHLNDIKKWTDKNRNGENSLEKQADKVSEHYSALKYLEQEKEDLAKKIGWALKNVNEQQPKFQELLHSETLKKGQKQGKLDEIDNDFDKKKGNIQKEIGEFSSKIKEISTKRKEYDLLNINQIIERVAKKNSLELEQKNLANEKQILTTAFADIENRYNALLTQLANQFKEFENNKHTEKNTANANFTNFRIEITKQYETIFENIRTQNKAELETAQSLVKEKENAITNQKIKRAETKNKRFYETEIEGCNKDIFELKSKISNAENTIVQAKKEQKNLETAWQLEEKGIKADNNREIEKQTEKQTKLKSKVAEIENKIENCKDSLYGWLGREIPDWQNTIGQVIDDNVLFNKNLNPQKAQSVIAGNDPQSPLNFYGINIDLQEIGKEIKTIADYENEKVEWQNQITAIQKSISALNAQMDKDLENLRRKYHTKIKEQKDIISHNEYQKTINTPKVEAKKVELSELENKAKSEKQKSLQDIENEINRLSEGKIKDEEKVEKIKQIIEKQLKDKQKEKEAKIKAEQQKLFDVETEINSCIRGKKTEIDNQVAQIKQQKNQELDTKGADTKRISEIDLRISELESELAFIETNRDKVAEYNKDKRELFDREAEFKNQKTGFESQLETEKQKYEQQKSKLIAELGEIKANIQSFENKINEYNNDLQQFESFSKTEIYTSIEQFVSDFSEENKSDFSCVKLITEINTNDNSNTKRYNDLQEAINKFAGNFSENNLFSFKTKCITREEYFAFADNLKEFIDENKIGEYKRRFDERFAEIIKIIGRETQQLIEKEGEISQVINEINNDFVTRNFVGAIKSMELKTNESANVIYRLLVDIKKYNDENTHDLGAINLFSTGNTATANEKAIEFLKQLIKAMSETKEREITLSDSFELLFKIVENDNDTGWVEKLSNVGSEGTDTLVKAMINIMLLNVFKERAARKNKGDFSLHCMMDEIGKLHPNNVKGILKFANDRNILLINSSPTSYNAADYKYTYILRKDVNNKTSINRIVTKK